MVPNEVVTYEKITVEWCTFPMKDSSIASLTRSLTSYRNLMRSIVSG